MAAATAHTLPCLDLTKDPKTLEQGSQEWHNMCSTLRQVLEKYGGVLVNYDRIPGELLERMFSLMPDLFALPSETKHKNTGATRIDTYEDPSPTYEALSLGESVLIEEARAFTQQMYPDGNDHFCQTIHSISSSLLELVQIVAKMICDSYGAGSHYESLAGRMGTNFRMSKYSAPPKEEAVTGYTHTDGSFLTVLCQNDMDGLQFQSREGDWYPIHISNNSFVIFVGEAVQAWSNGRMFAVPHNVIHLGDKDRFTSILFFGPRLGEIVKAPDELTDNGQLPLFKPFSTVEYFQRMNLG